MLILRFLGAAAFLAAASPPMAAVSSISSAGDSASCVSSALISHPKRDDERLDLVIREHFIQTRLLDIQNLAAQRQDRLEFAVASLLGRTAGGVPFDDVDLALAGVFVRTVRQFARQRHAFEGAL